MIERKELGKITKAMFGFGGYDDAMFGFAVTLGGDAWGVSSWSGPWAIDRTDRAQWTEADREHQMFETCWLLKDTLRKAKKLYVNELVGIPVEATFDGNTLKSWRVLEEVL